jgi:hypothetical protein
LLYWYKSTNTDAAAAESLDVPFRASTLIQTLTLDDWMLLAAMEKEKVGNAAAKTAAEARKVYQSLYFCTSKASKLSTFQLAKTAAEARKVRGKTKTKIKALLKLT